MKKILLIGLVTAAMAVSGCEYSASQTTETSNGNFDVKFNMDYSS